MSSVPSGRSASAALALFVAGTGCTLLTDVTVRYRECVPPTGTRLVERFDGSYRELVDRCWASDATSAGAGIAADDGDLIIRPGRNQRWGEAAASAPILFRPMPGDFVAITRVEATATIGPKHCLAPGDAAGLVVRRAEPRAWTTLLVRPFIEQGRSCEVEEPPARAHVEASAFGFSATTIALREPVGDDGEAIIALCRQDDQLTYYTLVRAGAAPEWRSVHRVVVGRGRLDVGLTATSSVEPTGVEGHFAWAELEDDSSALRPDGCRDALDAFVEPEQE